MNTQGNWEEMQAWGQPRRRRGLRAGPPVAVRGGAGHGHGPKGHDHDHDHGEQHEHDHEFGEGHAGWGGPPWAALFANPGAFFRGGPWQGGRGGPGGPRQWGRARRGDVRSAIVVLLAERPMHGYEIISELAQRTDGMWRPSPGSVYPTLQLLEDEGIVVADGDPGGGKRRFQLTDEGRQQAEQLAQGPAPWEQFNVGAPAGAREMGQAIRRLMMVIRQVVTAGDEHERSEAVKILEDARRRLYKALAGEEETAVSDE